MSKVEPAAPDDLRGDYNFGELPGGVRGKYLRRYRAGTNLALLDPDVAAAFATDEAVNEALRTVLKAASAIARTRRAPSKAHQRTVDTTKVSDRPAAKKRIAPRCSVPLPPHHRREKPVGAVGVGAEAEAAGVA